MCVGASARPGRTDARRSMMTAKRVTHHDHVMWACVLHETLRRGESQAIARGAGRGGCGECGRTHSSSPLDVARPGRTTIDADSQI